jgi:hypothetical protein
MYILNYVMNYSNQCNSGREMTKIKPFVYLDEIYDFIDDGFYI